MKTVGTCRVVDALREWGAHHGPKRAGRDVMDALDELDVALTYHAPFVARILAAIPFGCVRVEISANDIPQLLLHDRRPADSLPRVYAEAGRDGDYVRSLAEAEAPVVGPLTCVCRGARIEGGGFGLRVPMLIFDGWHHAAAWILQQRAGRASPILANVIVTEMQVA